MTNTFVVNRVDKTSCETGLVSFSLVRMEEGGHLNEDPYIESDSLGVYTLFFFIHFLTINIHRNG